MNIPADDRLQGAEPGPAAAADQPRSGNQAVLRAKTPIRRKLMGIILLTSGLVLFLTCAAFIVNEFLTFRQVTLRNLATLGRIVADNSTAALAFDNAEDAGDVLQALRAEPHIVAASLYDADGLLFARFPTNLPGAEFPAAPGRDGYRFEGRHLSGFQPVVEGERRLGTLYVRSDMRALGERLRRYGGIALLVMAGSLFVAYLISRGLQRQISQPILALAETARAISDRRDYSVRAAPVRERELGILTDAFNHMLTQVQQREATDRELQGKLQNQLGRHELLNRITRAIGERQDLPSIFQVVIRNLEDNLPIDFGCVCRYDAAAASLTVSSIGADSAGLASELGLTEQAHIPLDQNGLARCVHGQLVYEPDLAAVDAAFTKRLARAGLASLVIAPLLAESRVFGLLLAARRQAHGFSSGECEFLRQLSEHVALATHQTQLHEALQAAYDDLRQSQQTVLQQERLRALGQMASGIAHDINNAISPISLYTESLLEREPNLSERARDYLATIQRGVDDVAQTVARMREFYRPREPQLVLAQVDLNTLARQVIEMTRARWRDLPQEQGVAIELDTDFCAELPKIMGAEHEIRDALTNLVFNAVDAMPNGGVLALRTDIAGRAGEADEQTPRHVTIEVRDTGVGMDEETRRRCLEPFYTTKGERGTGLGLAMVFGMVQRHSADLEIESVVGTGTAVRLVFPVPSEVLTSTIRVPASALPARGMRILIVDDDPLLIKSLRDTLAADGHAVSAADGGQAGIDAFIAAGRRGEPFAAVITDLGMPYVDGRKVAAAIRSYSPRAAIILLTGWGQRLLAEADLPPGVDRVLSKPPKLHELRAALAELAARHSAAAS